MPFVFSFHDDMSLAWPYHKLFLSIGFLRKVWITYSRQATTHSLELRMDNEFDDHPNDTYDAAPRTRVLVLGRGQDVCGMEKGHEIGYVACEYDEMKAGGR